MPADSFLNYEKFEEVLERYKRSGWRHITEKWVAVGESQSDIRHLCPNIGFMSPFYYGCNECGIKMPDILKAYIQLSNY